jgi:hypothetical protein
MEMGHGYWAKVETTMMYQGGHVVEDTVEVRERWNIVGGLTAPVPVSEIVSVPEGIISSPFYGFDGSYSTVDTLYPGKGYWVKVSQDGEMILRTNALR